MATTYDLIASQTLGSAAASITFSSIAASWTDLRLVVTPLATSIIMGCTLRFNSDSTNTYSNTLLIGNGSAASSTKFSGTAIYLEDSGFTSSNNVFYIADIFSYAGSTYKTVLSSSSEDKNGSGEVIRGVQMWRNTAAIASITIFNDAGVATYAAGTTAQLYGIKAA